MTSRQGLWLRCVCFAAVCAGCAGTPANPEAAAPAPCATPPATPKAPSPSSTASAPSAASASGAASGPVAATATPAEQAAPGALMPICQAKCDKLVPRCTTAQVETCRINCTKFDPAPNGCDAPVRRALECARDARDLTCANVAPESCIPKFRDIAACSAGETAQNVSSGPVGLPEGWERVTDSTNGFSLAMPRGSVEKAGPEGPIRSVTAADGTLYSVTVLPLLKEKPSEKSLLHFLMKVQGRCSDKVKLDGFIEKADRSSIHYTAHCPDKTDWNGMIYNNSRHLFLLSAQAPAGKLGITDPFFYEFQYAEH